MASPGTGSVGKPTCVDTKEMVLRCRALRKHGDAAGCLVAAERFLASQPDSPAINCHLCWSYLELGRPKEAQPRLEVLASTGSIKSPKLLQDIQDLRSRCHQQLEDAVAAATPRQPSTFSANNHELQKLQSTPAIIRNICMLAHVDHGKTSLTDGLVASNRIISDKQIGVLRYMDSREDEQDRGITMKASCISLLYRRLVTRPAAVSNSDGSGAVSPSTKDYLINLIDSPGHIDFCSEVSTAVRICDGAIVVVDVVEGVCVQTIAVLRQAWQERVKTVLVLNKLDRLIMELQLSPDEASEHIHRTLEQVNAVIGSFYAEQLIAEGEFQEDARKWQSNSDSATGAVQEPLDHADEHLYYAPETGNVVFASAVDGWAFRPSDFADLTARKQQLPRRVLRNTLWGPFYHLPKEKKIVKRPNGDPTKTLFVKFVLEVLWQVYHKMLHGEISDRARIAKFLQVDVPTRELNHTHGRAALRSLCSRWLPLASALFATVVRHLPSPVEAQSHRLAAFYGATGGTGAGGLTVDDARQHMEQCNADHESPTVVYVSKMFTVHPRDLPGHRWCSVSHPCAVPPRTRIAGALPAHYQQGVKPSMEANAAVFDPSAIVVTTGVKDVSIKDLVAHCKTSSQLEEARAVEAAQKLGDASHRAQRRKEIQTMIDDGTATDEHFEELTQIAASDVMAAQAARVEKMQRKKMAQATKSRFENCKIEDGFIPSVTFVGAKPGFLFQTGARGVGYYQNQVDALDGSAHKAQPAPNTSLLAEPSMLDSQCAMEDKDVFSMGKKIQDSENKMNVVCSSPEDGSYGKHMAVPVRLPKPEQECPSHDVATTATESDAQASSEGWKCGTCLQYNTGNTHCAVCLTARLVSAADRVKNSDVEHASVWQCGMCLQQNTCISHCEVCMTKRQTNQVLIVPEPEVSNPELETPVFSDQLVEVSSVGHGDCVDNNGTAFDFDLSTFGETFIGLARVFSGTLREGQQMFVVSESHAPKRITVGKLFMPMGRSLEAATAVPAGNVCAIGGLDTAINRCGTLTSMSSIPAFRGLRHQTEPIVRVAVTPHHPSDLAVLANGLQLLTHADPAAVAKIELNGEHILIASGEVHLQVCLKDLRERFAKVPFEQSAPVVPFRETVHTEIASSTGKISTKATPCGKLVLGVRAVSLPTCVTQFLEEHRALIQSLVADDCAKRDHVVANFREGILETLHENDLEPTELPWLSQLDRVWAFGPNQCGSNILLNCIDGYTCSRGPFYARTTDALAGPLCEEPMTGVCFELHSVSFEGIALSQESQLLDEQALVTPGDTQWLCSICKQENLSFATRCTTCMTARAPCTAELPPATSTPAALAQLSGAVISTMTQACRGAFSAESVRLVEPVYDCEVITTSDAIGVSCEVLARRRAKVTAQDLKEGTLLYSIRALMPVVESLSSWAPLDSPAREVNAGLQHQVRGMKMIRESFSDELRKRTSGVGSAQLSFSHWAEIDADPFWVPTTEEEKEDFGEFDREGAENLARKYIDDTRRRKGLWVEEKIIVAADKQRTRARKKG